MGMESGWWSCIGQGGLKLLIFLTQRPEGWARNFWFHEQSQSKVNTRYIYLKEMHGWRCPKSQRVLHFMAWGSGLVGKIPVTQAWQPELSSRQANGSCTTSAVLALVGGTEPWRSLTSGDDRGSPGSLKTTVDVITECLVLTSGLYIYEHVHMPHSNSKQKL